MMSLFLTERHWLLNIGFSWRISGKAPFQTWKWPFCSHKMFIPFPDALLKYHPVEDRLWKYVPICPNIVPPSYMERPRYFLCSQHCVFPCTQSWGPPRGHLFPCSPEINRFVPVPQINILMFYVPCSLKSHLSPCSPQVQSFVPLFPWNKLPCSHVPQNPWKDLATTDEKEKVSWTKVKTFLNWNHYWW